MIIYCLRRWDLVGKIQCWCEVVEVVRSVVVVSVFQWLELAVYRCCISGE
jgi:hypothetical protein